MKAFFKTFFGFLFAIGLSLSLLGTASAQVVGAANCNGKLFNPLTDTDWNNVFPITIMGLRMQNGGSTSSPLMDIMPPICLCPTVLGIPFLGVGVTYWQPQYLSEVERRPGCISTLSGLNVLPDTYQAEHSNQTQEEKSNGKDSNRMQVHWFEYPLFKVMDMFKTISCKAPSGFNLAYMTEVDPLWQDDMWSAIFAPESVIFATPPAQLACAIDAAASIAGFPMDPLFWCAGTWGSLYPLAGNSTHAGNAFTLNNQIQAKFLARNHRMGLGWQTTGPTAVCHSHPNPVWIKSQYRYNQVAPITRKGRAVTTGDNGALFQFPPITNVPTQEHTVNMIWQGQQCCLKGIP